MENKEIIKSIIKKALTLDEYQRKQIISVLIASTLSEQSNKDADNLYNNIINRLIKEKNDIKNELNAHLDKQLDMPTEDDFNNLEDENAKLKKEVAYYINLLK